MIMLIKNISLLKGHICNTFIKLHAPPKQYLIRNILRSCSGDSNMSKRALVFLAPGYEELEAIAAIDILRRAGICVCIAGLPDKNPVKSARDVEITPGIGICDVANSGPYDVMVLPGGLGCAKALSECKEVGKLLKDQECSGRKIAAICASPTVLKAHCIAIGKKVTSYPAMAAAMKEGGTYDYQEEDVVVDGDVITSRGPGTATAFGLTIVKELVGKEKACEVAKAMLINF